MEMEKAHYVIVARPSFAELLRTSGQEIEQSENQTFIVAITQGGFGQDIVDDDRQVKERFLEHLFSSSGIDLPRTDEAFDQYFELQHAEEFIDLDEEQL